MNPNDVDEWTPSGPPNGYQYTYFNGVVFGLACNLCAAIIADDPRAVAIHDAWHGRLAAAKGGK